MTFKRFALTLALSATCAFGQTNLNLSELYRTQGIDALAQIFEQELLTERYWDKQLQHKNVRYGYFETPIHLLTCVKDKKSLKLYDYNNKEFTFVSDSSAFLGKLEGDKQREGDLKTPVGVYEITKKLTNVDKFYGPMAFVTSYPNIYDKARGKNGYGIWIHGLPIDQDRDDYTRGCIAIDNQKLVDLDKNIDYKKTFLVTSQQKELEVSKDEIKSLLLSLFKWRASWKDNQLDEYLSFYDANFKKSNGQRLKSFSKNKRYIFSKKEKKEIRFNDISILPYPTPKQEKLFYITFNEFYQTKSYTFKGEKELVVKLQNKKFKILTEK